jgi:hypothetical protein
VFSLAMTMPSTSACVNQDSQSVIQLSTYPMKYGYKHDTHAS